MKTQLIDFEGNFGSQDPALQPTAEDFARLSEYIKAQRPHNEELIAKARRAAKHTAQQPAPARRKTAA